MAAPDGRAVPAQAFLGRELELFPEGRDVPDLSGIDLDRFVAPEIAKRVVDELAGPDAEPCPNN